MSDNEQPNPPAAKKSDLMHSIGHTLMKRREVRGLSIEKVSATTKIRPQTVLALEQGNWHELPGEVYVRGFVIQYARFLGLNGLELITPYLECEQMVNKTQMTKTDSEYKEMDPVKMQWIWISLGGIGLLVLIKFIFSMATSSLQSSKANAASQQSRSEVAVSTTAVTAQEAQSARKHKLEVYSPNPLWLRVSTEKKTFEGNIPERSTWTWESEGTFTIRLGHTKEVSMHFDGREIAIEDNQKRISLPDEN